MATIHPVVDLRLSDLPTDSVRLLAVGDVALPEGPVYGPYAEGFDRFLHPDVADLCADKDFSIAGLECTLFSSDTPISKFGPTLHASHKTLDVLRDGRFDAVTLANNHILDYGANSMFRTRDLCEQSGFRTVGVGRSQDDAGRPMILACGALRLAIIAMAEEEFSCATATQAGAAPLDVIWATGLIREAKREADVVIIVAHCGSMYYPLPSPRTQRWLRTLVDAGASAVIAHHSHIVEGVEVYHGAPILYGLGNFVFPFPSVKAPPKCWPFGLIARLTISKNGVHRVECFLTKQSESDHAYALSPPIESEWNEWQLRMRRLNEIASSTELVSKFWDCFCHANRWQYFTNLFGCTGLAPAKLEFVLKDGVRYLAPHYAGLFITGLLGRFLTSSTKKKAGMTALVNFLKCPSHHEAILRSAELVRDDWPLEDAIRTEFSGLTRGSG